MVDSLNALRIQTRSLGAFDFRNGQPGLFPVKGTPDAEGTAFGSTSPYRDILLPDNMSPRAADLLPIFLTGVPNLRPYQLATGKRDGKPLDAGKPFIWNRPTLLRVSGFTRQYDLSLCRNCQRQAKSFS